jgi:hypothetical protein
VSRTHQLHKWHCPAVLPAQRAAAAPATCRMRGCSSNSVDRAAAQQCTWSNCRKAPHCGCLPADTVYQIVVHNCMHTLTSAAVARWNMGGIMCCVVTGFHPGCPYLLYALFRVGSYCMHSLPKHCQASLVTHSTVLLLPAATTRVFSQHQRLNLKSTQTRCSWP